MFDGDRRSYSRTIVSFSRLQYEDAMRLRSSPTSEVARIGDVQVGIGRIVSAPAATRGRIPNPDPEGHTVEQGPGSIAIDVPEVDVERVVSDIVQVAVIDPMRVAEVVGRPIPRTTGDGRVRRDRRSYSRTIVSFSRLQYEDAMRLRSSPTSRLPG